MTDQQPISARPGDTVLVLVSGLTVDGRVLVRGDEVAVTEDLLASTRDTRGVSWLDDLSEDAQVRRWRKVMLSVGPRPDGFESWVHGSTEWATARETARREAWCLPDSLRASGLAEVERRFGRAPTSSTILNAAPDPSIKLAEEQELQRRLAGVRQVSSYSPERREV